MQTKFPLFMDSASPPSRRPATSRASTPNADLPSDSFDSSRSGWKLGAGLMAVVAIMGATGCTPPPRPPAQASAKQAAEVPSAEQNINLKADSNLEKNEPLTELDLRARELELREKEIALREKELEILQKQESESSRLRKLQSQREAFEKGKRTAEGISVMAEIFGEAINGALR